MNNLRVWGDNSAGQISGAPTTGKIKAIAGGSINGLALRQDGTPVLWGSPPSGVMLGAQPIDPALTNVKFHDLAIGRDDAALLRPNGTLKAFGQHSNLKNVPAGSFLDLTVAAVFAVAIAKNDRTLRAWGSDSFSSTGPVVTGLLNVPQGGPFQAVDASVLYSLALHEDGTIYGWGSNGVLSGWTQTPQNPDHFYRPGEKYTAIAAGNVHALALRPDGTVAGWGDASGGALQAPAQVRFKAISTGWGFSLGLQMNGTLWGWGTPATSPLPAAQPWTFASQGWSQHGSGQHYYVPNERFQKIATAAFHIMAIRADH